MQEDSEDSTTTKTESLSEKWTRWIHSTHQPVLTVLHGVSGISARNPRTTIATVIITSLALIVVGLATNFHFEVSETELWTPKNSKPEQHMNWIEERSGFPKPPRDFNLLFHQNGGNVVGDRVLENLFRVFEAFDAVRGLPGYDKICSAGCTVDGIVNFWNQSASVLESQIKSNDDAITALSAETFPDGTPVAVKSIFGLAERDSTTNRITEALSFTVRIRLPESSETEDFETDALDKILEIRDGWSRGSAVSSLQVEVFAERSFSDEFTRAIVKDIPLVPLVFVIMSIFTCAVFFKRHKVNSRSLLGFGAVVSVMLSIMSGYGFMFICGVPFSSMTQILPFIIFGIGLDDAFIISGSYTRLSAIPDPVERINTVIDEVGMSITLTTITSTLAFGLGCISSLPAVFWLCLYAAHTIVLVLVYQLTFFVACIVLDEERIKQRRRDCCLCLTVPDEDIDERQPSDQGDSYTDAIMFKYAKLLMKPWVKAIVVIMFAALAAVCGYSTSQLKQEFRFTDLVPDGSYVPAFFDSNRDFAGRSSVVPEVFFRFVDQSDPLIQEQMERYIDELVTIDSIETGPEFFWLSDFKSFLTENGNLADQGFGAQMDAFLSVPAFSFLYGEDIVRDASGSVIESRCSIRMDNVDVQDVKDQVKALKDQRAVTVAQPINKGKSDWAFFTYQQTYNIWEFYDTSIQELTVTTIIGVVSVTVIAALFIPHWTAPLFVLPLVAVLYVDLLGFLQFAGVTVNAVSYVTMVISIGLLVDFIMHILHRFYELKGNRTEKAIETLHTMGSSILLGAVSTFIGTLPLAFSSSEIFRTVFVAFVGMVVLGATHGLVLLPVVLSLVGPVASSTDPASSVDEAPVSKRLDEVECGENLPKGVSETIHDTAHSSL